MSNETIRILLVNKDKLAQKSLYEMLSRAGYSVDMTGTTKEALNYINEKTCHVIISDVNGSDGNNFLKTLKKRRYPAQFIVLTSYGNAETAANTIKMGASDYLVRPVEDDKIIETIERAVENMPSSDKERIPRSKSSEKEKAFHGLVGTSHTMVEIYSLIERIADSKATILLRGQSGTGKRMIAHAIHQADKKRRGKPFIEVSCGALPREIIESELFGHTKGSFTGAISDRKGRFELANSGTILLDDIDSFGLDLQVKLLRVLQQREFERVGDHKTMKVDVRIIATTNQDIEKLVAERKFREDLYYRLNVISINIPPLKDRKEDLQSLVDHFISVFSKENHKQIESITRNTLDALLNYHWPGNIRELENIIERAIILDTDCTLDINDLPDIILSSNAVSNMANGLTDAKGSESLKDALQEPEKIYILKVLEEAGWNKKKAAVKLGVNRTTLYNKLRKYNIDAQSEKTKTTPTPNAQR